MGCSSEWSNGGEEERVPLNGSPPDFQLAAFVAISLPRWPGVQSYAPAMNIHARIPLHVTHTDPCEFEPVSLTDNLTVIADFYTFNWFNEGIPDPLRMKSALDRDPSKDKISTAKEQLIFVLPCKTPKTGKKVSSFKVIHDLKNTPF